jgi:RNA polymerase sigma-70 factor (ECF subfamily)
VAEQLVAAPGSGTESMVQARETRDTLEAALATLDEPYRSIVVMREIQDMAYAEIVNALEMPLNTVKVYLHRGRRMLREALRGKV